MKTLADFLYFLFKPGFWLVNYPYSPRWDAFLNEAMDNADPEYLAIGSHTLNVRGACVWIKNYPYAYGTPCGCGALVPWTQESVKNHLWKPVQEAMFNDDSTAEMDTAAYNVVRETLTRHAATKLGVTLAPWPQKEFQE